MNCITEYALHLHALKNDAIIYELYFVNIEKKLHMNKVKKLNRKCCFNM